MLKKTITYNNPFTDEEVSEIHYFHYSKAELVELEMSEEGGLSEALPKIIETRDGKVIMSMFKDIILNAYGKRSDDGKRFVKTPEIRQEFESSEAYSTLFMELVTDAGKAAEFVNGIIPKGLAEEAAKVTNLAAVPEPELPKEITRAELDKLDIEELRVATARIASGDLKIVE